MRPALALSQLAACFLILGSVSAVAAGELGVVKEQPKQGRFVKVEGGFMVPYTMTIPGTKAQTTMEPIPGGVFQFGSPENEAGHEKSEGPLVTVKVPPFWMSKYEVTWAEYKEFMYLYEAFKSFDGQQMRKVTDKNKVDAITAPTELYDPTFTFVKGEKPKQPAVTMTQYAAKQYTKWLSLVTGHQYRLPSEAEWEYACRAGSQSAYHYGDDAAKLGDYAWFVDNSDETTQLVGKKKPNAWGLHDMHGNVSEWVLDQLDENGYARLKGKSVDAAATIRWPTKLYPRVVRGGNWDDEAVGCRAAAKMGSQDEDWKSEDPNFPLSPWWFTTHPSTAVGFRPIRPLSTVPVKEMAKYWDPDVDEVRYDVLDRLIEGRGVQGLVGPDLPEAIKKFKARKK